MKRSSTHPTADKEKSDDAREFLSAVELAVFDADADLRKAKTLADLEAFRVKYLGTMGRFRQLALSGHLVSANRQEVESKWQAAVDAARSAAAPVDGGPVHPVSAEVHGGTQHFVSHGISLRDYFAAKAMQAIHAKHFGTDFKDGLFLNEHVARSAYGLADAMLAARSALSLAEAQR